MDKEKWIEDIISSVNHITPAKADASLYDTIKEKLQTPVVQLVPVRWIYVAAASVALLLIFNISSWKNIANSSNEEPAYRSEFSLTGNNSYSLNY